MTIYYVNAMYDGKWRSCGGYTTKALAEMMAAQLEMAGIRSKVVTEED